MTSGKVAPQRFSANEVMRAIAASRVFSSEAAAVDGFGYVVQTDAGAVRMNSRGTFRLAQPDECDTSRLVSFNMSPPKVRAPLMAYALSGETAALDDGFTNESTRVVAIFLQQDRRVPEILGNARTEAGASASAEGLCRAALRPFVRANRQHIREKFAMNDVQWGEVAEILCAT